MMDNSQKCLDFIDWFDGIFNARPGMLGSVGEIFAMYYVVDNIKNILLFGEEMPKKLSWGEYMAHRKLLRDLKYIPIEDGWSYDNFIELRNDYLMWLEIHRGEDDGSGI